MSDNEKWLQWNCRVWHRQDYTMVKVSMIWSVMSESEKLQRSSVNDAYYAEHWVTRFD